MAKVLVLYHSFYGHVEAMAKAVADGAREVPGTTVDLKRVPETIPIEQFRQAGGKVDQAAPVANPDDLAGYDAIVFGTGTRFGNMTGQMRTFLDQTGALWMSGALVGKVGSVFCSSATQHGGQESTILTFHPTLLHHGMIIVGLPYAEQRQMGKFEVAEGGTVFIDELGELPLPVQGKLLRVLQDREFDRVGGTQTVRVDVRIVAATHRDLAQMVREGKFREDLYYRIKVVELMLPPLRERGPEDLERIARHFIASSTRKHHITQEPRLSQSALDRLKGYQWPGNVRELENCIESAVVLCDGDILPEHLPLPESSRLPAPPQALAATGPETVVTLAEVERRHILSVLERAEGNRTLAAKWLGIGRNTLGRKLKEYGLAE